MTVFILGGKKYDTDKMEFISDVKKWYKNEFLSRFAGEELGHTYYCKLYRSKKQNFLLTHEEGSYIHGEAITEEKAKKLLMNFNYKKYEELFGEIEEA